jgi:hypothetical protein
MRSHPRRAVLRRFLDEPGAVGDGDHGHIAACPQCGRRLEGLRAAAAVAGQALGGPVPGVDPLPALRQLRAGETRIVPPKPRPLDRLRDRAAMARRRSLRVGAVGAVVVVAMGTLVATGVAGNLVQIFQPESFTPVSVNLTSFTSLPDLSGFGSLKVLEKPTVTETASAASAAAISGLPELVAGNFPASVKDTTAYLVATQGSGSFTFHSATAAGTAGKLGKALPALPAGLDGATLTLTGGPAVVEFAGSQSLSGLAGLIPGGTGSLGSLKIAHGAAPAAGGPVATPAAGARTRSKLRSLLGGGAVSVPQVVVVEMKPPTLYSNGPSVSDFENALLSMPGVPASVASQIRSLGDRSSTMPIPIPTSLASSSAVSINGAPGLLVGDSTGIASAVMWQSHGLLYAVAGSLTDQQVVAIARSLH